MNKFISFVFITVFFLTGCAEDKADSKSNLNFESTHYTMVTIGDTGISFSTKTNKSECFACKVKLTTNIEGQEVITTFFDTDQDGILDKIFLYLVQSEEGEFIPVTTEDQRVFSKSLEVIKVWQKNVMNI